MSYNTRMGLTKSQYKALRRANNRKRRGLAADTQQATVVNRRVERTYPVTPVMRNNTRSIRLAAL